jgi:hypothetical protein
MNEWLLFNVKWVMSSATCMTWREQVTLLLYWFSPGTPVSSTTKTDHHDRAEILLKGALNTTALTH